MNQDINSYLPEPDQIKKNKVRKVYAHVDLDPDEQEALENFRNYVRKNNLEFPSWVDDEQRLALRMMDSTNRKPKEAVKMLQQYMEWLNTLPVPVTDDIQNLMEQGTMYVIGRDYKFHPVIVISQRKLIDSGADIDLILRMTFVVMNWVIENMLVPGKVETWSMIMDSTEVSTRQMEMSKLKKLTKEVSVNYACRVEKSYQVNTPTTLYAIWKVLSMFLGSDTREKVVVMKDNYPEILRSEIPCHFLEQKYGGDRPNIESNFFPPSLY